MIQMSQKVLMCVCACRIQMPQKLSKLIFVCVRVCGPDYLKPDSKNYKIHTIVGVHHPFQYHLMHNKHDGPTSPSLVKVRGHTYLRRASLKVT